MTQPNVEVIPKVETGSAGAPPMNDMPNLSNAVVSQSLAGRRLENKSVILRALRVPLAAISPAICSGRAPRSP
ncbi:MAG: hypothetical protein CM15mP74_19240 [Halieaceae bacterium]|nr:MAG: hypothetical protein CM15mP74_19240 [Halieaceae bacterium]